MENLCLGGCYCTEKIGGGDHIRFGKNSSLAGNVGLWVPKKVNFVDDCFYE